MKQAPKRRAAPPPAPDREETREHVMAAGRELLLAAGGALRFCREYVETSVPPASRANLLSFFQKAIAVADELGRGIAGVSTLTKTAGAVAKPLFTAMGEEMQAQRRAAAKAAPKETPCPRSTRRSSSATRTASSTTRRTRATSRSKTSAR